MYTIDYTLSLGEGLNKHAYTRREIEIDYCNSLIRRYATVADVVTAVESNHDEIQAALHAKMIELGWGSEIELTIKTMLMLPGGDNFVDPCWTFRACSEDTLD